MKEKILLISSLSIIAIAFALSGCSKKEYAKQGDRTPNVRKLEADQDLNGLKLSDTLPLVGALESSLAKSTQSACEKIDELTQSHSGVGPQFRLLGSLTINKSKEGSPDYFGGVDLQHNPFYLHILSEKVVIPSDDDFMKQAQDLYKAGQLSYLKFAVVKDAYLAKKLLPSALQFLKRSAVQDKISENFPGAFGAEGSLNHSFILSLLKKAQLEEALQLPEIQKVLTTQLDLFPRGNWEVVKQDMQSSLQAAIYGSNYSGNSSQNLLDQKREKVCALVLWHRSLSQMLKMKGYTALALSASVESEKISSKLVSLSSNKPEFQKVNVGGVFKNKENVSNKISDEELVGYEPTKNILLPIEKTKQNSQMILSRTLSLLEAMTYTFEATSPVAPWMITNPLLGNLEDLKSPAFLPEQMHTLSLGLLSLNLKNLATFFITDVNEKGARLQKGESRKGILIQESGTYQLEDLLKMIRVSIYLENAIKELKAHAKDIKYDQSILKKLSEGPDSVMQNMQDLRTPLALQVMSMLKDSKCVAKVKWNADTGEKTALADCSAELEAQAKQTLGLLGQASRTPVLMKYLNTSQHK